MRNSKRGPSVITQLEKLMSRGNHTAFFKMADTFNASMPLWSTVALLRVELLIAQGFTREALDAAFKLKNTLCLPEQRLHAALLWQYLHYLTTGRLKKNEHALKRVTDKALKAPSESNLHLSAIHIQLSISADKLMIGNTDANIKTSLVQDFNNYLQRCIKSNLPQHAFLALKEISYLMQSKPFPMINECSSFLNNSLSQEFIQKSAYRKAIVLVLLAEITLEQHLKGYNNSHFKQYYQLAQASFAEAKHTPGMALIHKSYGRLLLKYGNASGKKFLDRAIRSFERQGASLQLTCAYHAVIQWLEKQGNATAVAAYRTRVNENEEVNNNHILSQYSSSEEGNLLEIANRLIYLNHDSRAITNKLPEIQKYGDTIHHARVLEHLFKLKNNLPPIKKGIGKQVVDLYNKLGHKLDAAKVIKDWLIGIASQTQKKHITFDNLPEIHWALQRQQQLLEEEKCLESKEILTLSHQVASYIFINSDKTAALEYLERAEVFMPRSGFVPQKALHNFYKACIRLETAKQKRNHYDYTLAAQYFDKAHSLFESINNREGIWRSKFGKAVCLIQKLEIDPQPPALAPQLVTNEFNYALQEVSLLTQSQVKTHAFFGAPLLINTTIQTNAFQLFQVVSGFLASTPEMSIQSSHIKEQLHDWCLLNQNRQETQTN